MGCVEEQSFGSYTSLKVKHETCLTDCSIRAHLYIIVYYSEFRASKLYQVRYLDAVGNSHA